MISLSNNNKVEVSVVQMWLVFQKHVFTFTYMYEVSHRAEVTAHTRQKTSERRKLCQYESLTSVINKSSKVKLLFVCVFHEPPSGRLMSLHCCVKKFCSVIVKTGLLNINTCSLCRKSLWCFICFLLYSWVVNNFLFFADCFILFFLLLFVWFIYIKKRTTAQWRKNMFVSEIKGQILYINISTVYITMIKKCHYRQLMFMFFLHAL